MEVYSAKGSGTYPLAFIVMSAILLNAYCCSAAVLVKTNTTFRCDGRLDECLLEEDLELELDFLINPYVSRILTGVQSGTGQTGNADRSVCDDKKGTPSYQKCIADLANTGKNQCVPRNAFDKCPKP